MFAISVKPEFGCFFGETQGGRTIRHFRLRLIRCAGRLKYDQTPVLSAESPTSDASDLSRAHRLERKVHNTQAEWRPPRSRQARLTGITQDTAAVGFSYDSLNRRSTLTLPNGIQVTYAYDNAGQLTGLTYQKSGSTLGNLTYAYDAAGRRTAMGGTLAQVNLPVALTSTTHDVANHLSNWGTHSLAYDDAGNLIVSAGGTTFFPF